MLDIHLLRKNAEEVAARLRTRPFEFDVAGFAAIELQRKAVQSAAEEMQARRNALSKQVAVLKSRGEDASAVMAEAAQVPEQLKELALQFEVVQQQQQEMLLGVPNLPHASVPVGRSSDDNVEVRRWGTPRSSIFRSRTMSTSAALGLRFRTARQAVRCALFGAKGGVARLHRALAQFMLDTHTGEHGYTECYTPYMVNADSLRGTGQLPKFEEDLFRGQKRGRRCGESLYLIPTSEVSLTNLVRAEIVAADAADQDHRAYAVLPFRSRQRRARHARHDPPASVRQGRDGADRAPGKILRGIGGNGRPCRGILQRLGLPYRVLALCTGDMGFSAAKTYDLEVWLPAQNTYREISSLSNCEASRRGACRRVSATARQAGTAAYLERSGLAVGRTLVAILENFQQADGSVRHPRSAASLHGRSDAPASSRSLIESRACFAIPERWQSGLMYRTRNAACCKAPWVRIPPSPPDRVNIRFSKSFYSTPLNKPLN